MNNVFLSSLLMISSIFLSNLALYGIRKRQLPGAFFFSVLMLAMTIHSVGYAFELLSHTLEHMYFWTRIEYIGTSFYPTLIMLFAREYTDEKKLANKYILTSLLMINIVTFVLVNTNSYHFLYYSSVGIDASPGFNILALKKGVWYFVQVAALYFSISYSVILFTIKLKKSIGDYRKRMASMLIGVTIPLIAFIAYLFDLGPAYIDLLPFSYLFMSLFIAFGMLRYHSISFIPITHEMIFNSIDEAVLVIDKDNLLVRFNRASTLFFPSLNDIKIGDSIQSIPELYDYPFDINQEIYEWNGKILHFKQINVGNNRGSIYVINDITESEQAKKRLEVFATKDDLTGLYNRRHFMTKLHKSKENGIFVMIDIDHFKNINDTFGHTEGDYVLIDFSHHLRSSFPEENLCRYGGEEFALFIENKDLKQVFDEIETFRKKIEIQERTIKYTFSAGLAQYTNGNYLEAINQADKMLYAGKKTGRNQTMY